MTGSWPAVCVIALVAVGLPVEAGAGPCDPIKAAYEKLAAAPAYRQTIKMAGQKPTETMAVGDTLYMNDGSGWESLKLKPGQRLGLMLAVIGQSESLTNCAEQPGETMGGVAVKVYSYDPPAMDDRGQGGPQTLWVGADDGLPRRMRADTVELAISYEDVAPPKTP